MRESEISTSSIENNESLLIDDQENIKQLPDIFGGLKFNLNYFGNLEIEPDLYYENKYYFFDLKNLKEKLFQKLNGLIDDYQFMFQPIRQDLLEYVTNLEDRPFVERPRTKKEKIKRWFHYFLNPNDKNPIQRANALKLASIIHEINLKEQQNNLINYFYIGCIDNIYANIIFLNYSFIQKIDEEIKVVELAKNNDDYIEILSKKIKSLQNFILESNEKKKEKYIFINFLIKFAILKLKEKDILYNTGKLKKKTEDIMKELCRSINSLICEYKFRAERNSNILFKDIYFRNIEIKIAKDLLNEKEIFINKNNIKKLNKILSDELDLKIDNLLINNIFHDNKTKEDFKDYVKKQIEQLENEKFELLKLKNKIYNKGKRQNKNKNINPNGSTISTIIDKSFEYIKSNNFDLDEQDKDFLNKKKGINEEKEKILIEIIKIVQLKDLVVKKVDEAKNKNIEGIMIIKRINDKYQLLDNFTIYAIHF